jgi:hypothetical protein
VNLQKNYDLRIAQRDLLPLIQSEVKPLELGLGWVNACQGHCILDLSHLKAGQS